MPYSPTTWVEGVTKLGPTNMNHIELGIAAAIPKDLVDAKGDLIVASAADTVVRKAVGADGRVLSPLAASADGLTWLDLATVAQMLSMYDAKGDLIAGTANDAAARLAAGVPGQILVPDSAQATGLKWADGGMVRLFNSELGAPAANFDITAIPADYESLKILAYLRGDTAAANTTAALRFNGDAAGNYDTQRISAAAAAAAAAELLAQTSGQIATLIPANTATANVFGFVLIEIFNYADTTDNKVFVSTFNHKQGVATTNLTTGQISGFWRSNAAITQVTLIPGAGNFQTGSRVAMWGIG